MQSDGYFPFFSNCEAFDGRISIEQALEDAERCNLVAPEDTIPINEFNWGATERYSDTCDYVLRCAYEEDHRDLREHVQPPVWPRASDGGVGAAVGIGAVGHGLARF